jgi:phage baseplate assembly protein gpV
MDRSFTMYGEIAEIVRRETRYLRHYWGEVAVTTDPLRKGRVKVIVPVLGWDDQSKAAWCTPRQLKALVVPNRGDFVEVYFMEGNPEKPVYIGQIQEFNDQTPEAYSVGTDVVYDSGDTKITVNTQSGQIDVEGSGVVNVKGGTVTVEAGVTLTLKSGDAIAWAPNILPNCLFTGAPHGGTVAGIVKLKGG